MFLGGGSSRPACGLLRERWLSRYCLEKPKPKATECKIMSEDLALESAIPTLIGEPGKSRMIDERFHPLLLLLRLYSAVHITVLYYLRITATGHNAAVENA